MANSTMFKRKFERHHAPKSNFFRLHISLFSFYEYAIQVYSHQNHHSRRSKKRETGSPQEF